MFLVVLALLGLTAGAGGWYWHVNSKPKMEYKTAKVVRGEMLATIPATGTVEPEETVDVGAQVQGQIVEFGKDVEGKQIDNDSVVKAGMLLAKIDETTYKSDVDTAQAMLGQAKASVQKAEADRDQAKAKLYQAQRNWERAQKVGPSDALSVNDYDNYQAEYLTAVANVGVAEAEIAQAKTNIASAQAALDKANRNLEFCTIKSPVDGVVIQRRVNIGQTVVSSLNAPSLFLLGKDLTRMQIWVAVNEADLPNIYAGQDVNFTFDGMGEQVFKGQVNKVRLYAQTVQNVVTYTVEVTFSNPDGKVPPYRTANVQFVRQADPNVLMVPNSALRWYPTDQEDVVPDARSQWKPIESDDPDKSGAIEMPKVPKAEKEGKHDKRDKKKKVLPARVVERKGFIWITEGQFVRPVQVTVGATDSVMTEVSSPNIHEGADVVVGEVVQSTEDSQERNPFLPQMRKH
jgi:HlyD family secretion protein